MTPREIAELVDSLHAEMPEFLKSEAQKGRGAFQLRIEVQDRLSERLSARKLSAALAIVDRRIAELFGTEPEPLEPLPAQSDAPALPTDREAALFKELEWRVLDPFEGTSDGSHQAADQAARQAERILAAFLNETCPRYKPALWGLRARLREQGRIWIETARKEAIWP